LVGFSEVASTNFGSDNHKVAQQPRAATMREFVFGHFPARWKYMFAA
jgi:hypothetical protein